MSNSSWSNCFEVLFIGIVLVIGHQVYCFFFSNSCLVVACNTLFDILNKCKSIKSRILGL